MVCLIMLRPGSGQLTLVSLHLLRSAALQHACPSPTWRCSTAFLPGEDAGQITVCPWLLSTWTGERLTRRESHAQRAQGTGGPGGAGTLGGARCVLAWIEDKKATSSTSWLAATATAPTWAYT
jgi:hypothetical protein